jgi:hypothetical protein
MKARCYYVPRSGCGAAPRCPWIPENGLFAGFATRLFLNEFAQ